MKDLNLQHLRVLCACYDAVFVCDGVEAVEFSSSSNSAAVRFMFNQIMREVETGEHGEILSEEDYIDCKVEIMRNVEASKQAVVQQAQAWFDAH